jgi:hypothetical protein
LRRAVVVAAAGAEILPVSGAHGASPWLLANELSPCCRGDTYCPTGVGSVAK